MKKSKNARYLMYLLWMALFPAIAMAQKTNDIFHPTFNKNDSTWFINAKQKNDYLTALVTAAKSAAYTQRKPISLTKDLFIAIFRSDQPEIGTIYSTLVLPTGPQIKGEVFIKNDDSTTVPYNYLIDFYVGSNFKVANFEITRFDIGGFNSSSLYPNLYQDDIVNLNETSSGMKGYWLEYDQDFPSSIEELIIKGY